MTVPVSGIVEYDDQDETGAPVVVRITATEAIRQAKAAAAAQGYVYATDELALYDFCVVHWARVIAEGGAPGG